MKKPNPYDAFSRHGGKLTRRQFGLYVDRIPHFHPSEREYIKRVMERYDTRTSRFITREEFFKGLDEMEKNKKDPITRQEIERIKKALIQ